jgi:putative membrane protein
MARIFSFIFILVIIILGLFFGNINADTVTLNYYWGTTQMPLSVALVLSLLCGALLGVFASLGLMFRLRHQISRLRKEVKTAEKEVVNLRAIPLKDDH